MLCYSQSFSYSTTPSLFIDSNNSFLTGLSKSTISNSNNVEVVSSTSKIK